MKNPLQHRNRTAIINWTVAAKEKWPVRDASRFNGDFMIRQLFYSGRQSERSSLGSFCRPVVAV